MVTTAEEKKKKKKKKIRLFYPMKKIRVATSSINQPVFSFSLHLSCMYAEKKTRKNLSCHRAHIEGEKKKREQKREREREGEKKTP
jgi:hypothetical protein